MTLSRRVELIFALVSAIALGALSALVGQRIATHSVVEWMRLLAILCLIGALAALLVMTRNMRSPGASGSIGTLAVLPYLVVAHLFGGLFAFFELFRYRELSFEIARHQHLLPLRNLSPVVLAVMFAAASALIYRTLAGSQGPAHFVMTEWNQKSIRRLRTRALVLLIIGCASSGFMALMAGGLALVASNVDGQRYAQGQGLGLVSLLQYTLIPSAAIFLALAASRQASVLHRAFYSFLGIIGMSVLLAARAERTSLLLPLVVVCFLFSEKFVRGSWLPRVLALVLAIAIFFSLGLWRFSSQEPTQNLSASAVSEQLQVRPLYDIAPEIREQMIVFSHYPQILPYHGVSALQAIAISPIPGTFLSLGGIDKSQIYTDSSREFSQDMRRVGVYVIDKPLRVGLLGELYMIGGWWVVFVGWLLYVAVCERVDRWKPKRSEGVLARAATQALLLLAFITPLGAVLPIGAVVVTSILIFQHLSYRSVRVASSIGSVRVREPSVSE
jgi:hypothetical protein